MLEITAAQARAHNLPAVTVKLDTSGTAMEALALPQPGKYVVVSGPPGGPLLVDVWATAEAGTDAAAIERAARALYNRPHESPFTVGAPASVDLAGGRRNALAFITGQGMIRTAWCAAIVPTAAGNVLVALGMAAGKAPAVTCDEILADPDLGKVGASLRISA